MNYQDNWLNWELYAEGTYMVAKDILLKVNTQNTPPPKSDYFFLCNFYTILFFSWKAESV